MKEYIRSDMICGYGCGALKSILEANHSIQEYACENGCIDILLIILKIYANHKAICGAATEALGIILSSKELRSEYCTEEVLDTVRIASEKHKDSEKILHFYNGLSVEGDSKVSGAVARGVCTNDVIPKCGTECGSDEGGYCPKCCVQQKAFRCLTCDKGKFKVYCESCWKRDHQGHKCEEFFYPVRCGTSEQ